MGRLILIRHCATSSQGPEAPLTAAGAADAVALIPRLAALGPDALYSSPYARARATIAPFAEQSGMPIIADVRLRERLLAEPAVEDWMDQLRRSFNDWSYRAPGGESLDDAQGRALAALAEIDARGHRLPAVASHGNLISSILATANPAFGFDDWQAIRTPDLFEIELTGGRPSAYRRLD